MPFWSKKNKEQKQPNSNNNVQSAVVIMESDILGMTVIQQDKNGSQLIKELSTDEWIDILQAQELNGYPYERIYFSFLKGIPTFLRLKIWLLLCSENNAKKFKFTSKTDKPKKGSDIKISELTIQIYQTLCENQPLQKQKQQIQKDIHRSFSIQKVKYKYLAPFLRKLLYASSNSGIQYTQGMNYILLNIIIFCLESLGVNQTNIAYMKPHYQKDIFIIFRQIVIRMEQVFGQNNIMEVIKELQQKIAQSVPQILFVIYNNGLDCFSAFAQNYFSVMTYNDPPEDLSKQMWDLFFLTGQKAIHATIVRMLQVTKDKIVGIKNPQTLQMFLKTDIYNEYYKVFVKEKQNAKRIQDFGLCCFESIQRFKM